METEAGREKRQLWMLGGQERLVRLALVGPVVLLVLAILGVTIYARHLLATAGTGGEVGSSETMLLVACGIFLAASAVVMVVQLLRVAHRVAGPEYRVIQTLRQIRAGDLTTRVHLRRGDLLRDLAHECNALIDWLNRNPPKDTLTGSDVVEMEQVTLHGPEVEMEESLR